MLGNEMIKKLEDIFGNERVILDTSRLVEYSYDMTENEPHMPDAAVLPVSVEEVQNLIILANEYKIPLIPRVAGTNLGGLTIPTKGGIIVDLRRMNRIFEVNPNEMYALIEPGVTFGDIRKYLDEHHPDLIIGYPLSPPNTSILCNALLDGLVNLSFLHGSMGEWINGIEVVLPTGEIARVGAGALSNFWFAKAPLPDLSGLFISWQGTTGIVTKLAIQLWPKPALRKRMFILAYHTSPTFSILGEFSKKRIFDDIGCLSWTTGKMMFGIEKPLYKDPDEPEYFIYIDVSAETKEEMKVKLKAIKAIIKKHNINGKEFEPPIEVSDLVKLNPAFEKFADFPTNLDFLTEHSGGGLTWLGTYGPLSTWEMAVREGSEMMAKYGFPPTHVNRPMKGGHFVVMRFIMTFNKKDENEVKKVAELNHILLDIALKYGFIPYKTPPWAVRKLKDKLHPGFWLLLNKIRNALDPAGIMNPGKWEC